MFISSPAGIMLLFTLRQSFVQALTISAIARLLTYAATCLALLVLLRKQDFTPPFFRLPGGTVISILVLILAAWLLTNSTWNEALMAAIAGLVGLLIYVAYRLFKKPNSRPPS